MYVVVIFIPQLSGLLLDSGDVPNVTIDLEGRSAMTLLRGLVHSKFLLIGL
jgi:hypothetical protein